MPVVVYSALRLGLFVAALVALWLVGMGGWLLVVVAAVVAWALSYLLLRRHQLAADRWIAERRAGGRPRFSPAVEDDAATEDAAADDAAADDAAVAAAQDAGATDPPDVAERAVQPDADAIAQPDADAQGAAVTDQPAVTTDHPDGQSASPSPSSTP